MKSEKARHRLYESFTLNSNIGIDRKAAFEAAELAEQEAEERMREKAIKAYCHDCSCAVEYICDIGADNCLALQGFIQKLNEE